MKMKQVLQKDSSKSGLFPSRSRLFLRHVYKILGVMILLSTMSACGQKNNLDDYGGFKEIKGKKTGFFHLEKINGRDWFITPEGNVFFGISLSHLYSGESNVAAKNIFGNDKDAWLQDSFEKAKEMGFNCALGSASSPERNLNGFVDMDKAEKIFRENNFPYTVGVILLKHPWEFIEGEDLPDIFSAEYKELIESRAKTVCPKYKDDPLMMGYYYGFGAFNHTDNWVNNYLSQEVNGPARVAIVDLLNQRYKGDAIAFNQVYGMSLKSISDLKDKEVLAYDKSFGKMNFPEIRESLNPAKANDFEAITSMMAVKLYKMGYDAIKKWDNNHLIFGSYIKEWAISEATWKAITPYVDMIAPQHFNKEVSMNAISDVTGLPILFSDDYFGWHYPGYEHGGHGGLVSHDVRGEVYKASIMRHFKDPQVLGVTYCACLYDQGGNTLKKNNQNGIYDIHGKPRTKIVNDIKEANKDIYKITPDPAMGGELKKWNGKLLDAWEKYQLGSGLW